MPDETQDEIIKEVAEICSELGGIYDVAEMADGFEVGCMIVDSRLYFKYSVDSHGTVLSIKSALSEKYKKPEIDIDIGEPEIYYDDEIEAMVIKSPEIEGYLDKYGKLRLINTELNNYYSLIAQY